MRRVSLTLILVGLLCAGSAAWGQVELLTNPGFESGLTGWTTTTTHAGIAVVVTGAGGGACDPGGAASGSSWVSYSTTDGGVALPAGSGGNIAVEQTFDVTAFAVSIGAGTATIDLSADTVSVECMPSPDLAEIAVDFHSAVPPAGYISTAGTGAARPADMVWTPVTTGATAVPVTTTHVVVRYESTLGPSGGSVGIGGDTMSAIFTPVELQSFSID